MSYFFGFGCGTECVLEKSFKRPIADWGTKRSSQNVFGLLLGAASLLIGCGTQEARMASRIKQLGPNDFKCVDYSGDQISSHLKAMPDGFVDEASFKVGKVERVKNQMTGIPQAYLEKMYPLRARQFRIAERSLGVGVMGVTVLEGNTLTPLSVDITSRPEAVDFALQHELGHAIENQIRQKNSNFASNWNNLFRTESRNSNLRSYARSSAREYFAEAFANFYCSKDAQEFIGSHLPETYKFMKANLESASFDRDDGGTDKNRVLIRLATEDDEPMMDISVPEAVTKVALCKGSREECTKNPTVMMDFTPSPIKILGRSVFRSEKGIGISKDLKLTILLFDAGNKPEAARTITFTEAN